MILRKCECEHESHFFGKDESRKNSPNGNPNHRYGVEYNEKFIIPVATPFGTFHVCNDCADDCYQDYLKQAKNEK